MNIEARKDRPEWLAANAIGQAGEQVVAGLFQKIGIAVVKMRERSADLAIGGQIEVKHDRQAHHTGNVAVEVSQHGRPSGINATSATCWAFLLATGEVILISTARLRAAIANLPDRRAGEDALVRLLPVVELRRQGVSIGGPR